MTNSKFGTALPLEIKLGDVVSHSLSDGGGMNLRNKMDLHADDGLFCDSGLMLAARRAAKQCQLIAGALLDYSGNLRHPDSNYNDGSLIVSNELKALGWDGLYQNPVSERRKEANFRFTNSELRQIIIACQQVITFRIPIGFGNRVSENNFGLYRERYTQYYNEMIEPTKQRSIEISKNFATFYQAGLQGDTKQRNYFKEVVEVVDSVVAHEVGHCIAWKIGYRGHEPQWSVLARWCGDNGEQYAPRVDEARKAHLCHGLGGRNTFKYEVRCKVCCERSWVGKAMRNKINRSKPVAGCHCGGNYEVTSRVLSSNELLSELKHSTVQQKFLIEVMKSSERKATHRETIKYLKGFEDRKSW